MDTMLKTFWISGNTPSSKNSKTWTGKFLINSKVVSLWIKETELEWEFQKDSFVNSISELPFPLYIEFTFYRKSKHTFDYINACQIVQDQMVEHKWITDDNALILKPYFGDFEYNKEKPGVIIKVLNQKPKHY